MVRLFCSLKQRAGPEGHKDALRVGKGYFPYLADTHSLQPVATAVFLRGVSENCTSNLKYTVIGAWGLRAESH